MYYWLNIGSLILALVAWILPVINLMLLRRNIYMNFLELSLLSISSCAISLCFQMIYIYHLVEIKDVSALMDTNWAVALISTILLVFTLLLNIVSYILYRKKQ